MTTDPNPVLGIALHALGGLGAASYYVLFSRVKGWAWETYWLVAGLVFLVVCPWVIAFATVPELLVLMRQIPENAVITAIALGLGWGVGNLGFGLSLRYLGISLGYCLTLAFCVLFGTLGPPLVKYIAPHSLSNLANQLPIDVLVQKLSGQWTLAGMVVAIVGIGLCGIAGLSKERELSHAAIRARVPDYHFWTGLAVACVAGAMSSCINYAITDTEPISLHLAAEGVDPLWANSLTMAIFLSAGSVATIGWCIYLNATNRTLGQYLAGGDTSLTKNYLWCTLAGMLAYSEFFFYGLAAPNMGKFSFTNLPIHLALVIVFSNVWGILLAEWRGTSARTKLCIFAGNVALLLATILIGRGAFLDQQSTSQTSIEDMALHQGTAIDIATTQR